MTKLLITEITRMGPGFCVIGLRHESEKIQSIRPIPSASYSWRNFPYRRGDILEFSLTPFPGAKPHIEDRVSMRSVVKSSAVREAEAVSYLRRAEMEESLAGLFGCRIHENGRGSGLYALPKEAARSVCGCETQNLRLEMCGNELRATLVLPSGEVLRDLPVVDRDWLDFVETCLSPSRGANCSARLDRFLNSQFHYKIMTCPHHFIRLGLTRPFKDLCWLMLDTLFPLPQLQWLEEI